MSLFLADLSMSFSHLDISIPMMCGSRFKLHGSWRLLVLVHHLLNSVAHYIVVQSLFLSSWFVYLCCKWSHNWWNFTTIEHLSIITGIGARQEKWLLSSRATSFTKLSLHLSKVWRAHFISLNNPNAWHICNFHIGVNSITQSHANLIQLLKFGLLNQLLNSLFTLHK